MASDTATIGRRATLVGVWVIGGVALMAACVGTDAGAGQAFSFVVGVVCGVVLAAVGCLYVTLGGEN